MTAIFSLTALAAAIYILSVITDEFFISSLDRIALRWKLPSNVAGASLMAMGSSAPELSIAVLALFKDGGAHSDMGIGTIVGSAVFNILVITGVCAVVREARITLPIIVRDAVFYLMSILILLVTFWDGRITVSDALVFLMFYAGYLAFLFMAPIKEVDPIEELETAEKEIRTGGGLFSRINANISRVVGWAAGNPEQHYFRAFGVSILLIVLISWFLVDTAVIFSNAVGIPPVIVALTILAAGTSAPDLIASILVARRGRGDMAVANAVGSNIFDILVGLGFPWALALLFLGRPVIAVGTEDLILSVLILMGTVVVLFTFLYTDRLLSKKEGWGLLGLYAAYVVWTVTTGTG
ncbi:MAG: calcium/sodium antiporter [Thermodesulfobacteriota bacterium]